jgi:hypothetical protein
LAWKSAAGFAARPAALDTHAARQPTDERAKKIWTLARNRLILEWNTLIVAHLGSLRSRCWVVD